jgi:hypothetical protein
MKLATAYKRRERIFLHASAKTTVGVWILWPPVLAVDGVSALGQNIRLVLKGSRLNVPHPTSWTGLTGPLLRLANVRTWNAFARSAKCVQIESSADRVAFLPTRNGDTKEGFVPLPERLLHSPLVEEDLARTLLAAFEACQ